MLNIKKHPPAELDDLGSAADTPYKELFAPVSWQVSGSVSELDLEIGGVPVKAVIAHNLGQARELLTQIKSGISPYRVAKLNA